MIFDFHKTRILIDDFSCLSGKSHKYTRSIKNNYLKIFPNPASTTITIALPSTTPVDNTTLSIYNINAQQVKSCPITEPQTVIDIRMHPQGVYFVRITDDRLVRTGKFVKTVGL
jgi:hypothetical protein